MHPNPKAIGAVTPYDSKTLPLPLGTSEGFGGCAGTNHLQGCVLVPVPILGPSGGGGCPTASVRCQFNGCIPSAGHRASQCAWGSAGSGLQGKGKGKRGGGEGKREERGGVKKGEKGEREGEREKGKKGRKRTEMRWEREEKVGKGRKEERKGRKKPHLSLTFIPFLEKPSLCCVLLEHRDPQALPSAHHADGTWQGLTLPTCTRCHHLFLSRLPWSCRSSGCLKNS